MPTVLGIHAYGHEAGACVVTPAGVWALSEERLTRRKYDGGFPHRSMSWALGAAGVELGAVDRVVFDRYARAESRVRQVLAELGYQGEIATCGHHEAHAASAFYASGFDEALVLTLDAGGTRAEEEGHPGDPRREVQAWFQGRDLALEPVHRTLAGPPQTLNPGVLYGLTAAHLGFGSMGSGKVMGLSAHGQPDSALRLRFDPVGDPLAFCPLDDPLDETRAQAFLSRLYGVPTRSSDEPLTDDHRMVAATVQQLTQETVVSLVRHLARTARTPRLCLAGGFFLNCPTLRQILDEELFEEVFIQPAATDAGIPLGGALLGFHAHLGQARTQVMRTAALGGSHDIEAALSSDLRVQRPGDIAQHAARSLADRRIIGWFQGRSEFGPRALGHRSILADPRDRGVVERLNREIKHREPFRPYAPMVLADAADRCFDLPMPSPFMLLLAQVRPAWADRLPAVIHVDGTARVQTVSREDEPLIYRLLQEFERLTGVPALLNTSFNRAGEPMVETPADALEVFRATTLDALVLEHFWVER